MDCFVKETYGHIWHFYHNSHGICFCKMKDENITGYSVLLPGGRDDFDICIDDSDSMHIVCQNSDGDILYINHFNGSWKKTTVLKSKNKTAYDKDFSIIRVGNWLNLFFCIEYNGNKMLTHKIMDKNDTTPFVIDCIKNKYSVSKDSFGNIHILYYSETNKSWGLKKYVWSKKEWSDFSPVSEINDCENAFLFTDSEDKIHILFEIDCFVKELFDGRILLHGTGKNPFMVCQSEITVMWEGVSDGKIFVKKESETSPSVFMPCGFLKPSVFKIRYTAYEPGLIAKNCFGNIYDGKVKIYGINNFFAVSETPVSKDNPTGQNALSGGFEGTDNNIYIEIQKLKIHLNQISAIIEKIQEKTKDLDVEKINRRLESVENAVDKNSKNKFLNLF